MSNFSADRPTGSSVLSRVALSADQLAVGDLRCQGRSDNAVIDSRPWLTWRLSSTGPGPDSSSRVEVAIQRPELDTGPLLWVGPWLGATTTEIQYGGDWADQERAAWQVRTRRGAQEIVSAPAAWSRAPQAGQWSGPWLGLARKPDDRRCLALRLPFTLDASPSQALLHITAGGIARAFINGAPAGAVSFSPGYTDYSQRVNFDTIDVTDLLHAHSGNVVGVEVADGWWSGRLGWEGRRGIYGSEPVVKLLVELRSPRGTRWLSTDTQGWQARFSEITLGDLYDGEHFDARRLQSHWTDPDALTGGWVPAKVLRGPEGTVRPRQGPGAAWRVPLDARAVFTTPTGARVIDYGEILTGVVKLEVNPPAGEQVQVRFAEVLDAHGEPYHDNYVRAAAVDVFTGDGGTHVWQPWTTFRGFRYAVVSGPVSDEQLTSARAVPVTSSPGGAGSFACGSAVLSWLHEATERTRCSTFVEVPMDCTQRDERLGWMADAHVFAPTALTLADGADFFRAWLESIAETQKPDGAVGVNAPEYYELDGWVDPLGDRSRAMIGWSDACALIPLAIHDATGRREPWHRMLPVIRGWVEHVARTVREGIVDLDDNDRFDDWLGLEPPAPGRLFKTAYFAWTLHAAAVGAKSVGDERLISRVSELLSQVSAGFQQHFLRDDGSLVGGSQTAYAMALRLGLIPTHQISSTQAHLVAAVQAAGSFRTGIHGTVHLLPALSDAGRGDLAIDLLLRTQWPSFNSFRDHGATTIPERWDAWGPTGELYPRPESNSFNHCALGAVTGWLYTHLVGLAPRTGHPGLTDFRVEPTLDSRIGWAAASRSTPRGRVAAGWTVTADQYRVELDLPGGTTAELHLPGRDVLHLTSGWHTFTGALTALTPTEADPTMKEN